MSEQTEKNYHIVFKQKIKHGFKLAEVKKNLERFFNNNSELVEQLFSKEHTVLKKNISKEQAEKYKIILESTGIHCEIIEQTKTARTKQSPEIKPSRQLDDLEKVTRFLVKVTSLNQKIMWLTLTLSLVSIGLWVNYYFDTANLSRQALASDTRVFSNNWDNLSLINGIKKTESGNGLLHFTVTSDDPGIIFPRLPLEKHKKYQVDIKLISSVASRLQLFFSDNSQLEPPFTEKNSLSYAVKKGENNFHIILEYQDLGPYLRLDPIARSGDVIIERLEIKAL